MLDPLESGKDVTITKNPVSFFSTGENNRDYILDGTVLSVLCPILSGDLSLVGLEDGLTPALPHQVDHLLILVEFEPEFDL